MFHAAHFLDAGKEAELTFPCVKCRFHKAFTMHHICSMLCGLWLQSSRIEQTHVVGERDCFQSGSIHHRLPWRMGRAGYCSSQKTKKTPKKTHTRLWHRCAFGLINGVIHSFIPCLVLLDCKKQRGCCHWQQDSL